MVISWTAAGPGGPRAALPRRLSSERADRARQAGGDRAMAETAGSIGRLVRHLGGAAAMLLLLAGAAGAAEKVRIAVGGASCVCYLPTMLAKELGEYDKAGLDVELINFKGGSQALTAVLGGSADVVSGFYDHCVNLAAKGKSLEAFVTYDRYPGLVLVVSPKHAAEIRDVKDLAGRKVGVSAPGSSTDFFLKYLLRKNGVAPDKAAVIGIGADATAIAAMEQGQVDAGVLVDPAVTYLQVKFKDLRILADTRTEKDTLAVFGGEYPGGALYAPTDWVQKHDKEAAALATAIVATLKWIHAHSAEEIMGRMPKDLVGNDTQLYVAALKNTIPMYSTTGKMDPKGAQAVLDVFSQSVPEVAQAHVDLGRTYTNKYAEEADAKLGVTR
jgi:NitT/TauT family transport system substrate-binding protein